MTTCPKCNNTQGFVFGMCIECGWNHLSNEYDKIEVWAGDIKFWQSEIWEILVDRHNANVTHNHERYAK